MTTLKSILVIALAVYLGLARDHVFRAARADVFPRHDPDGAGRCRISAGAGGDAASADGTEVIAWHVPPKGGRPVVIYFHGNGGSLRIASRAFCRWSRTAPALSPCPIAALAARKGSPSEAGLIEDARAAYDFARTQYPDAKVVLWGESLGTGVAVAIAAQKDVAAVVLEAPYTSTADIAFAAYPFIPVRLLMKDQFRSDERIGKVKAPLLDSAWRAGPHHSDRPMASGCSRSPTSRSSSCASRAASTKISISTAPCRRRATSWRN